MKEKFWNFTYKITNSINGKYYYGCHSSDFYEDDYMGSGVALAEAKNKYGIENFKIKRLKNFPTRKEMFNEEKILITKVTIKDNLCYNLQTGGIGNHKFLSKNSKNKISNTLSGRTKETHKYLKNMSDKLRGRTAKNNLSIKLTTKKITGRTKEQGHKYLEKHAVVMSDGIWITPYGKFYSSIDASKTLGVSRPTIIDWCKNNENKIPYLTRSDIIRKIKNYHSKTYKEIGFSFLKFPKDCSSYKNKKKFAIDNNVNFDNKQKLIFEKQVNSKKRNGLFITPYGNFTLLTYCSRELNVSSGAIVNYCINKNNELIDFSKRPTLCVSSLKNSKTKTYNELGFSFIEYPQNCNSIIDKLNFAKLKNIKIVR